MYAGLTYGAVYRFEYHSADGRRYRADVERQGWLGGVFEMLRPDGNGLVSLDISGGQRADGAADALAPVAASVATLTAVDGQARLAAMQGAPDGAWRLRLFSATPGGAEVLEWLGYALQETFRDAPLAGINAVEVKFADGLGFLNERPHAGEGTAFPASAPGTPTDPGRSTQPLAEQVARHLGDLGAGGGWTALVAAVDWRPRLGGAAQLTASDDPLYVLHTLAEAWLDADGASTKAADAVRAIAARMGGRLCQSAGRWHLMQRSLLARTGGLGVPRFVYALGQGTDGETTVQASAPESADVLVDVWQSGRVVGVPRREVGLPVRRVESGYSFRPDLDAVIYNGSFERAGSAEVEAEWWTAEGPGIAAHGAPERRPGSVGDLTQQNAFAMRVPATPFDNQVVYASQTNGFRLSAPPSASLRVRLSARAEADGPFSAPPEFRVLAMNDDDTVGHGLALVILHVQGPVVKGDDVAVPLSVLAGTDEGPDPAIMVPGVRIADVGQTLRIEWGDPLNPDVAEARLTRTLRAGDAALYADLRGNLPDNASGLGVSALTYVFAPGHGGWNKLYRGAILPDDSQRAEHFYARLFTLSVLAPLEAGDGAVVRGRLRVDLRGQRLGGDNSEGATYYDGVEVTVAEAGGTFERAAFASALPAGAPGTDAALPVRAGPAHVLGDGPTAESESQLFVRYPDGTVRPTLSPAGVGWAAGLPSTFGDTADALSAREALAQVRGPLEGWLGTVDLSTVTVRPHHVLRVWQRSTLAAPVAAGAAEVLAYAAPAVGETLRIGGEARAVAGVRRGLSAHVVELSAPLAQSHAAGAECHYTLLVWPDAYTWRTVQGRYECDGRALAWTPGDFIDSQSLS